MFGADVTIDRDVISRAPAFREAWFRAQTQAGKSIQYIYFPPKQTQWCLRDSNAAARNIDDMVSIRATVRIPEWPLD